MGGARYLDLWGPTIGPDAARTYLHFRQQRWLLAAVGGLGWPTLFVGIGLPNRPTAIVGIALILVGGWLVYRSGRSYVLAKTLARQHVGLTVRMPVPLTDSGQFDRWLDGQQRAGRINSSVLTRDARA